MPEPASVQELAEELRRRAAERRAELVDRVLRLAAVDAPSGAGAQAMAAAAASLVEELEPLGGRLRRTPGPQGELLEVELGPASDDRALVLGHYDTVWPAGTRQRRPAQAAAGRITGPGVFDMRAGISAALTALSLIGQARLPLRTTVLLTPDEETGSATSAARIVELAREARWVLVLEPPLPGGAVKTARSGWAVYRVAATGRAAHAGLDPDGGVSAIEELCDALIEMRDIARPDLGTRLNPGVISGGTGANTVAAAAEALIDVRAQQVAEQERVDRALAGLRPRRSGAQIAVERRHLRPPMERTPAVSAAYEHARAAARLQDLELGEGRAGGTSDANLVAHLGVPVLDGLGPDGGGAHAEHEHVLIDSLVERCALMALLLACPLPRAA